MKKASNSGDTKAPGHFGNQGPEPRQTRQPDREERHQRTREQAPQDDDRPGQPRTTDGTGTAIPGKKRLREVLR